VGCEKWDGGLGMAPLNALPEAADVVWSVMDAD